MRAEQPQLVKVVNLNNHAPGSYYTEEMEEWERKIPYWRIWNVTRPNIFGNPFVLRNPNDEVERTHVLMLFAEYWYAEAQRPLRNRALMSFPPGSILGCVCAPKACHADIIAGYLNWRRHDPGEIQPASH